MSYGLFESQSQSKNDFDICLEKIFWIFFAKKNIKFLMYFIIMFTGGERCAGPKFNSQNFHRLNWGQLHDVSKMYWSISLVGPCVVSPELSFENGQKVAETKRSEVHVCGYISQE